MATPPVVQKEALWPLIVESLRGSDRDFARLELRTAIPLLAIPMVLEMALESIFAVADVYFVSRLGPDAIATVGLTESLMMLIYALAIGLSMPVTAMVARRMGERKGDQASSIGGQALLLGLVLGALLGLPAPWVADDLLEMMGASSAVLDQGLGYITVMMTTNIVIVLLFLLNAVFRGAGDATRAMRALWIANGINLVLDPCLIFGLGPFPELGLTGAAVATSIGRGVGVLYQLYALTQGPRIKIRWGLLRPDFTVLRTILRLSIGGVGQYLIGSASWIVLVRILAEFGSVVVAGYTVAIRIVFFALLPSWGFANATSTLVGQSLGAGDVARARRAVLYSGLYNMTFLGLLSVLLVAIPETVASILTDDSVVVHYAGRALMIVSVGYIFYAWEMVLLQAFNGAGDTKTPVLVNFIAFWLVQIPMGWLLAHPGGWGPDGVFVTIALASSLAGLLAYLAFRRGDWANVKV